MAKSYGRPWKMVLGCFLDNLVGNVVSKHGRMVGLVYGEVSWLA